MASANNAKKGANVRMKRKERKNIAAGQAHIQSTFNNTVVTITDLQGNAVSWCSSGSLNFRGSRKSTPFAAQSAAETAAKVAIEHGMKTVEVYVKGPGAGRESAIRALQATGLEVTLINSIYTHKEIFLRELISNASDATDKLYYNAMKEGKTGITRDSLPIELTLDKANRRFIIEDHGCGMTAEEMENNLGTIAHSGSLAFKNENEKQDDIDIIGQFGVGFYAAFMVAKHVEVVSRAAGSAK